MTYADTPLVEVNQAIISLVVLTETETETETYVRTNEVIPRARYLR